MQLRATIVVAIVCLTATAGGAAYLLARPAPPAEATVADDDDAEADEDDEGAPDTMQAKARICKKLSCTENQRGELGTQLRNYRDLTRDKRTEAKNLRASVAEAWATAEPDAVRIAELETRIAELDGEIETSARHALLAFHKLLDDEQRRKLAKWLRRKPARDVLADRRQREEPAE